MGTSNPIWALICILASLFLFQFTVIDLGKIVEDGLSAWASVTHMGEPDEVPGSNLVSLFATICGVEQLTEICLSLLLSL